MVLRKHDRIVALLDTDAEWPPDLIQLSSAFGSIEGRANPSDALFFRNPAEEGTEDNIRRASLGMATWVRTDHSLQSQLTWNTLFCIEQNGANWSFSEPPWPFSRVRTSYAMGLDC